MFAATAAMALSSQTGSTMYDLLGSLSVFGFLTAYALVALALPFARRALGQHSHVLAAVSVFTVAVILTIAIFDLKSADDAVHARIPYLYLGYIASVSAGTRSGEEKASPRSMLWKTGPFPCPLIRNSLHELYTADN